jgi:acyl carrier protein
MSGWNLWLRGRSDRFSSDRDAPPVRTRSGEFTPPGLPAPHPSLSVVTSRTGVWGLREYVEPRLRRLVADALGVEADELTADVSLTDDLAADSLDLLELVLAIEGGFDLTIPERRIDELRTYGDLVDVVMGSIDRPAPGAGEPAPVWARVIPGSGGATGAVERAVRLTPYAAQTIADEAVHAGHGARLEVEVPIGTSDRDLHAVQSQFARLGERGVQVHVRRRSTLAPPAPLSVAASARR